MPVRWAHVSELADPVPYMEGGELLLITALKLDAEDREAMRRYVRRLVGAGVVGLGFAVGVHYEEIPAGAGRRGRGGGAAAARGAAPHALPRHQQGRLGGDRRRPVPGGDRRLRGAARADQAGAGRRPRGGCSPRSPRRSTAGPRCTTPPAPSSPPRPSGRPAGPPGSPPTWSGCATGPPRPASVGRRQRRQDRVELQSLGTGRRVRGALAVGTGAGARHRRAVRRALGRSPC